MAVSDGDSDFDADEHESRSSLPVGVNPLSALSPPAASPSPSEKSLLPDTSFDSVTLIHCRNEYMAQVSLTDFVTLTNLPFQKS